MKLIDCAPQAAAEDWLQTSQGKIKQKLSQLFGNRTQVKQKLLDRFQFFLDNRFVMIVNFTPQGQSMPVPFILIGPNGITVLNVNNDKGIYRAKEENWLELTKTTRQYTLARENLIKQTQSMAKAVSDFLVEQGQFIPEITPVLIFTNPGVHIDASRPVIRLILADGIDRLIVSFQQRVESLNPMEVKAITDLFDDIAHPLDSISTQEDDFFGKDLGLHESEDSDQPQISPQVKVSSVLGRIRFTRRQWILIALLLIVNILLLMGLILFVVFTAA